MKFNVREDYVEKIGERLRAFRDAFELSQREVAESLGITTPTYCNWENERTLIPSSRREQFCEVFRVNRDWLEFGTGRMMRIPSDVGVPEEVMKNRECFESASVFLKNTTREYRVALYKILKTEFE